MSHLWASVSFLFSFLSCCCFLFKDKNSRRRWTGIGLRSIHGGHKSSHRVTWQEGENFFSRKSSPRWKEVLEEFSPYWPDQGRHTIKSWHYVDLISKTTGISLLLTCSSRGLSAPLYWMGKQQFLAHLRALITIQTFEEAGLLNSMNSVAWINT